MPSEIGPAEISDAADDLFERYATLGSVEQREALSTLANGACPYYDERRGRWLVAHYETARSILRDPRLGNNLGRAGSDTNSSRLERRLVPEAPSLLFVDPPEHDAIKTELALLFTREAVEARTDQLRERWREGIETLAGSAEVWLSTIVHPIVLTEVYQLFGLAPPTDEAELWAVVEDLYSVNLIFDLNSPEPILLQARAASDRMRERVGAQLAGSAVASRMKEGGADDDMILSTVVFMLRAAVVTLGSMAMSIVAETLSSYEEAADRTLSEALVRHTPTGDTGRVALDNIDVDGTTVQIGQTVIVMIGAANIDLTTQGGLPTGHLVFGAGTHRCVGERMVRHQIELVRQALARTPARAAVVGEKLHRTPSFRGFRDIRLRVRPSRSPVAEPEQ